MNASWQVKLKNNPENGKMLCEKIFLRKSICKMEFSHLNGSLQYMIMFFGESAPDILAEDFTHTVVYSKKDITFRAYIYAGKFNSRVRDDPIETSGYESITLYMMTIYFYCTKKDSTESEILWDNEN